MPGRKFNANTYRFGFNGKEMDNEISGNGNQYDYGFRIYNPRLVRFLSVDPLTKQYPELTPYQFASNSPIENIDLDGLEKISYYFTLVNDKYTLVGISTDYDVEDRIIEAVVTEPTINFVFNESTKSVKASLSENTTRIALLINKGYNTDKAKYGRTLSEFVNTGSYESYNKTLDAQNKITKGESIPYVVTLEIPSVGGCDYADDGSSYNKKTKRIDNGFMPGTLKSLDVLTQFNNVKEMMENDPGSYDLLQDLIINQIGGKIKANANTDLDDDIVKGWLKSQGVENVGPKKFPFNKYKTDVQGEASDQVVKVKGSYEIEIKDK